MDAAAPSPPREVAGRWRTTAVLKRDVFSTIERGYFNDGGGEVEAILRHITAVPWWSWPLARHFLNREARGLATAEPADAGPRLLFAGRRSLVRGFLHGLPLQIAKPHGDVAYFKSAKKALRGMRRLGVAHNDLAKEQNWLRAPDGRAYVTDFQLTVCFRRRGAFYRMAVSEDLRHLLKHKRKYVPEALTATEKRILARPSVVSRVWMATGKRVYRLITRGFMRYTDREGGGPRLVYDGPVITERLKALAGVRDAAVVAYPDRRHGTGLYAFVEASGLSPDVAVAQLKAALGTVRAPDLLQVVPALPRGADGAVRSEILTLVAMNQLDEIQSLTHSPDESRLVDAIVEGRLNLRDRHAF